LEKFRPYRGSSGRAATGRFDSFAKPLANVSYLRTAAVPSGGFD
jgi:hypothetical protein